MSRCVPETNAVADMAAHYFSRNLVFSTYLTQSLQNLFVNLVDVCARKVRSRRLIKGNVTPLFCLVDIHLLTKGVPFAKTALKTLRRAAEANMNLQVCDLFFILKLSNR